jgi:copper chaperone NosL
MFAQVKNFLYITLALVFVASAPLISVAAQTVDLPDGSKLDLSTSCPVCNMKLEDSKLGVAAVVFKDGKVVGFDSAGDMFRYVRAPVKYSISTENIKNIFVTEHGTKKFMDAKQAFFVVGSEVQAGMGAEVVPFSKKEDAEKFNSENKGKRVAAYAEVTEDDVKSQKKMLKMEHGGGGGGMKH